MPGEPLGSHCFNVIYLCLRNARLCHVFILPTVNSRFDLSVFTMYLSFLTVAAALAARSADAAFTWKNVHIGGGGGFIPGIVFNTKTKGVAYARADIGGLYRLNADDSWTPITVC